jgi:hypothetical protein
MTIVILPFINAFESYSVGVKSYVFEDTTSNWNGKILLFCDPLDDTVKYGSHDIRETTENIDTTKSSFHTNNGSILYFERTLWRNPPATEILAAILDFEFFTRVATGHPG